MTYIHDVSSGPVKAELNFEYEPENGEITILGLFFGNKDVLPSLSEETIEQWKEVALDHLRDIGGIEDGSEDDDDSISDDDNESSSDDDDLEELYYMNDSDALKEIIRIGSFSEPEKALVLINELSIDRENLDDIEEVDSESFRYENTLYLVITQEKFVIASDVQWRKFINGVSKYKNWAENYEDTFRDDIGNSDELPLDYGGLNWSERGSYSLNRTVYRTFEEV